MIEHLKFTCVAVWNCQRNITLFRLSFIFGVPCTKDEIYSFVSHNGVIRLYDRHPRTLYKKTRDSYAGPRIYIHTIYSYTRRSSNVDSRDAEHDDGDDATPATFVNRKNWLCHSPNGRRKDMSQTYSEVLRSSLEDI
jgi:hypothetical protein